MKRWLSCTSSAASVPCPALFVASSRSLAPLLSSPLSLSLLSTLDCSNPRSGYPTTHHLNPPLQPSSTHLPFLSTRRRRAYLPSLVDSSLHGNSCSPSLTQRATTSLWSSSPSRLHRHPHHFPPLILFLRFPPSFPLPLSPPSRRSPLILVDNNKSWSFIGMVRFRSNQYKHSTSSWSRTNRRPSVDATPRTLSCSRPIQTRPSSFSLARHSTFIGTTYTRNRHCRFNARSTLHGRSSINVPE